MINEWDSAGLPQKEKNFWDKLSLGAKDVGNAIEGITGWKPKAEVTTQIDGKSMIVQALIGTIIFFVIKKMFNL